MNREILFRGKRVDNGEWVYGYLYQDGLIGCNIFQTKPHLAAYIVDPSTVCQYTGLTDKNDTKIFEEDILQVITNYYGNRKECKITINFEEIENDSFGEPYTCGYCIMGSEWEVIGNTFDNLELLEENNT